MQKNTSEFAVILIFNLILQLLKDKYAYFNKTKEVMNTKFEEIDGKFIATLEGEMDTAAAVEAEEVLKPLYQSNGKDVIIDCTNLEYIASSGLRILLSILKGAKNTGSKVIMRGVNDDIKNVFKLTGFISIFEFEDWDGGL
jgi:anti-sigma B factor antagonist